MNLIINNNNNNNNNNDFLIIKINRIRGYDKCHHSLIIVVISIIMAFN